jgi:hypothetical protein
LFAGRPGGGRGGSRPGGRGGGKGSSFAPVPGAAAVPGAPGAVATDGPRKRKVKDDVIEVQGRVVESLPSAMFRVEIEPR